MGNRKKIRIKLENIFNMLKNHFYRFTGLNDFTPPLFLIALNKSSLGSAFLLNLLGFETAAVFVTGGGGGGGCAARAVGIEKP